MSHNLWVISCFIRNIPMSRVSLRKNSNLYFFHFRSKPQNRKLDDLSWNRPYFGIKFYHDLIRLYFFRMSIEIEEKDVVTTEFPICSVEYDEKNKFIYSGAYELLDGETRFFKNTFWLKSNAFKKDKKNCLLNNLFWLEEVTSDWSVSIDIFCLFETR